MRNIINRILIEKNIGADINLVILCGRSCPAEMMFRFCKMLWINKGTNIFSIEPLNYQWYPVPNGINDQEAAVFGQEKALENLLEQFKELNLKLEKTILIGYSAGGVMALELCTNADLNFKAIVTVAGVHLQPWKITKAKHSIPILMINNLDDQCFTAEERYYPTKNHLLKNGYNAEFYERSIGGHPITVQDAEVISDWLDI